MKKEEIVNNIISYLIGNITPKELEEKMPKLTWQQWHRLAIIRMNFKYVNDLKNQGIIDSFKANDINLWMAV